MSTELLGAMADLLDAPDYQGQPRPWTTGDLQRRLERDGHEARPAEVKHLLAQMVATGHVVTGTAADLGVPQPYGTPPATRLWVTQRALQEIHHARQLRARNVQRGKLLAQAREAVLERHQVELAEVYGALCHAAMLQPEDEPDTWTGSL